jgi:hypothetical protein
MDCPATMSADEPTSDGPKKWARIPSDVRLNLKRRIAVHLREHGNKNYDLLREDPDFVGYVGKALGSAAEKKFDRLVAEVRRTRPSLRASGQRAGPVRPDAQIELQAPPTVELVPVTPAEVLSGSRHAILGYDELQMLFARTLPRIEAAISNLHNEEGVVEQNGDLVKLSKEYRETVKDIVSLQQSALAAVKTAKFQKVLFERLGQEFRNEPERARILFADIHELIRECGDLPITTKELT